MCCEGTSFTEEDITGRCPYCAEPTVCETAYEACAWSPVLCELCGWAPCDESC